MKGPAGFIQLTSLSATVMLTAFIVLEISTSLSIVIMGYVSLRKLTLTDWEQKRDHAMKACYIFNQIGNSDFYYSVIELANYYEMTGCNAQAEVLCVKYADKLEECNYGTIYRLRNLY